MSKQPTTLNEQTTERKPYAEPHLIEYGDLETLTREIGDPDSDDPIWPLETAS